MQAALRRSSEKSVQLVQEQFASVLAKAKTVKEERTQHTALLGPRDFCHVGGAASSFGHRNRR